MFLEPSSRTLGTSGHWGGANLLGFGVTWPSCGVASLGLPQASNVFLTKQDLYEEILISHPLVCYTL